MEPILGGSNLMQMYKMFGWWFLFVHFSLEVKQKTQLIYFGTTPPPHHHQDWLFPSCILSKSKPLRKVKTRFSVGWVFRLVWSHRFKIDVFHGFENQHTSTHTHFISTVGTVWWISPPQKNNNQHIFSVESSFHLKFTCLPHSTT